MGKQLKRRSKEEMYPLIEEWKSSGLTKQAFCEQRGIVKSVFFYWCKKYREDQSVGGFLPINVIGDKSQNAKASHIEIEYPNSVIVRLPANTPPGAIRAYIHI